MEKITPESNCKNRHRGFMYGIRLRDRFACKKDPQWIFDQVAKRLKVGPLTMRINIYEGYADSETCSLRVPMKYTGAYRWVAVVGVALTPGMHGGVMFMVQDSCCPDHPFKNIPLDLVYDMNAGDELVYLDIDGKIVLPDSTHFDTNPRDIVTTGGVSPCLMAPPDAPAPPPPPPSQKTNWQICHDPYWEPDCMRSRRAVEMDYGGKQSENEQICDNDHQVQQSRAAEHAEHMQGAEDEEKEVNRSWLGSAMEFLNNLAV